MNRYVIKFFANTFSKFHSEYYWWDHDNSNKNHLIQYNYNKELKSQSQVSGKENQTSAIISRQLIATLNEVPYSIATLNEVTFILRVDFRSSSKT